MITQLPCEFVGEDLPEPSRELRIAASAKLTRRTMRIQQRLLDDIGRINARLQHWIDLHAGEQTQVGAKIAEPFLEPSGHDVTPPTRLNFLAFETHDRNELVSISLARLVIIPLTSVCQVITNPEAERHKYET